MLFFQYLNSTEKWQGAKFSVQFSFFFGLAFLCSGDTQLTHIHISAAFRFFTEPMVLKKKVLSYEIRSISSVLLIKSYFNIKYSYSILYTSFSLLAEYCYWLFKQKLQPLCSSTFWRDNTVSSSYFDHSSGGKDRGKDRGIMFQNSILGYEVGWKREVFQNVRTDPTQWNTKHCTH